ncbi:MAG: DUF4230 domain-containing protein [Sphingomonadales bacterium]|nr:DUF4230 domain-containing protein [Sphingomonadales bacterium]
MRKWIVLALIAVLALAAVLVWRANGERDQAEMQLGIDSARVLSQSFARANQLKVAGIAGDLVARSTDPGLIHVLDVSQTMKAPYAVDYFIDLSQIAGNAYAWDAAHKRLVVEIPDVTVGKPNIDESAATVSQTGLYISRAAGLRLQQAAAQALANKASEQAYLPANMERARTAAQEAVRANALAPLRAAGIEAVQVDVQFAFRRNRNDDVWDYTTPIEQVADRLARMKHHGRTAAPGSKEEPK